MSEKNEIWKRITRSLESTLPEHEIETWFSKTTLKTLESHVAVIEVPHKFFATWLRDHYGDQIKKSFKEKLNVSPDLRFTYPRALEENIIYGAEKSRKNVTALHGQLNPSMTFSRFVVGRTNRFAYSAALEVAQKPATLYNPLFIFSELSLGKTHLLHAIGNHILSEGRSERFVCIPSDRFISDFMRAFRNKDIQTLREDYEEVGLFLIDDIQQFGGKRKIQEELIALLNKYIESGTQVVVTGNGSPARLKNLHERLKSRLEWGLLSEIQIPDQKTKVDIILKKAEEEDVIIPEDAAFFLANTTADIKGLVQKLVRLVTLSSIHQKKIDISTVKSLVKKAPALKVGVRDIQKLTAQYFNISIGDLLSNKKSHKISYPRQMAMYLCRKLTDLSFKEIGESFDKKDHSTVIYAVRRMEQEKDKGGEVSSDLKTLTNILT
jgi:chromosomal replication initiator protein